MELAPPRDKEPCATCGVISFRFPYNPSFDGSSLLCRCIPIGRHDMTQLIHFFVGFQINHLVLFSLRCWRSVRKRCMEETGQNKAKTNKANTWIFMSVQSFIHAILTYVYILVHVYLHIHNHTYMYLFFCTHIMYMWHVCFPLYFHTYSSNCHHPFFWILWISPNPIAEWCSKLEDTFQIYALRDIEIGEELLLGDKWIPRQASWNYRAIFFVRLQQCK